MQTEIPIEDEELDDTEDIEQDDEIEEIDEPEEEPRPRRRSARSRSRRRPQRHTVNLKADFSMPIERLARLAEEDYADEDETPDPYPSGSAATDLAALPFEHADGMDGISTDEYLRQVKERNRVKALIYRVPKLFADRNPLISKKPASTPGWAFQGEVPFDPQTLDSDLLTLFSDGHYFIEIRDRGRFKAGFLRTIGNPQNADPLPPAAAPIVVHEPAPSANPLADTKAQVMMMNSVVAAATRLLEAKASAEPPAPRPPSLKERIDEMVALQRLLQPPQAAAAVPAHDPLERLANALESEAVKKVLNHVKSENPIATAEPPTGFWDFATQAAEVLAPGLNPLLGALGSWISGQIASQAPPQAPTNRPTAPPRPAGAIPPARAAAPQPPPPQPEENAVNLEFLIEDLFAQTAVEETAAKIRTLASKPFVGRFVKQYLAAPNEQIWGDLLDLCETEGERTQLQQSLAAATWKEDWINALKAQLNGGPHA